MTDDVTDDVIRLDDGVLVVAGQRYPWAEVFVGDADFEELLDLDSAPRLPPHHTRRAAISLENGYRVSVIWGTGTYSDNYDAFLPDFAFTETPRQAEVGVIRMDDGRLVTYVDDSDEWSGEESVLSYVDAEQINALIAWVATWPSGLTHVPLPKPGSPPPPPPPPPERNP